MPRFEIHQDQDGVVQRILKDGDPFDGHLRLELPHAIVTAYFSAATQNLSAMNSDASVQVLRLHGLQCFLMSLVGLEAFINIFFHLRSRETHDEAMRGHATSNKTVESKLAGLPRRGYGKPLHGQKLLNRRIKELYALRSAIVHPKWEPVSATFTAGFNFDGLVQNFQAQFENRDFCYETMKWCLVVVCRVGSLAGATPNEAFCRRWTGISIDNEYLSTSLGIPA